MSRSINKNFDYTSKDYEAFRTDILNAIKVKMPEYTDLSQSDAGVVIAEAVAQALDVLSFYQDKIANETYLSTLEQLQNAQKWCQLLGYYPRASTSSRFKQVFELYEAQKTDTVIKKGTSVKTQANAVEGEISFELTKDFVIPAGKLGIEKEDVTNEYIYQADIIQGISVNNELLGTSNNSEYQKFSLNYSPVVLDSIEIFVNEGQGFELWRRVNTFIDSSPSDKHYTVSLDEGGVATIQFGNNTFGKIPVEYKNGIYANYRVGGGVIGNVSPETITVLSPTNALIKRTFNPEEAYILGHNKETLEEIKYNAPIANRTKWGAITTDDFAEVVKSNFTEVKYAVAKEDTLKNIDDIYIYILLNTGMSMSDEFKQQVQDIFDENKGGRKVIGTNKIYLEEPTFVPLTLRAKLYVRDLYSYARVKEQITEYITEYFKVGNYPFNTELSLTELSSSIMINSGIVGIKSFNFIIGPDESELRKPAINEIYTLGSLTIEEGH